MVLRWPQNTGRPMRRQTVDLHPSSSDLAGRPSTSSGPPAGHESLDAGRWPLLGAILRAWVSVFRGSSAVRAGRRP